MLAERIIVLQRTKTLSAVFALALFAAGVMIGKEAQAQAGIVLGPNELVVVNKVPCGLVKAKWIPGKILKTGRFNAVAAQIKAVQKKLRKKNLSTAQKLKFERQIAKLKKKRKTQTVTCKAAPGLINPTPTATPIVIATPLPGATTVAWTQNATDVRLNVGSEYLYFCPTSPTASLNGIYGTDVYTTDSAVCGAAVHAGLFGKASGGNARIRIKEGQSFYTGSVRNTVDTSFYGTYDSSYVFVDLTTGAEIVRTGPFPIRPSQSAAPFRSYLEQTFSFVCPSSGTTGSLWGTDIYTDDSAICTAAVHAGKITLSVGGVVTIQVKAGQESYAASTRNGVSSNSYGSWSGSYVFVP